MIGSVTIGKSLLRAGGGVALQQRQVKFPGSDWVGPPETGQYLRVYHPHRTKPLPP